MQSCFTVLNVGCWTIFTLEKQPYQGIIFLCNLVCLFSNKKKLGLTQFSKRLCQPKPKPLSYNKRFTFYKKNCSDLNIIQFG